MTSPDMTPILKKCVAIVTDEGGMLCHASHVAREFGIPAIVGTKNATKMLKDGDIVEVDSKNGIVRKLN
jgi:pyruvate,water dikinase